MRIAFKFPSRSRPEKFKAAILNIKEKCKTDFDIYATLDNDDTSMKALDRWMSDVGIFTIWGQSNNKIHAVNRGMDQLGHWDILVCMSDDMEILTNGFDEVLRNDMVKNFPDLDGVLHYNDGMQKSNVMTMSIMGRKYYDRFGYIYNPGYQSLWCDVEATEVAYMLGKYKYMGNEPLHIRHNHPAWGLTDWDAQYRKTEAKELSDIDKAFLVEQREKKYNLKSEEIVNGFKYATL